MKKFDAIVIGSGQAGTPLVFQLAEQGQKVAFIEKEHFGGTCLNVGCTPTKAYVASARRMFEANHGPDLGVIIPPGTRINLPAVKKRKDELIKKSVSGIEDAVEKNPNITTYLGVGSFTGHKKISINGEEIAAENIYINVGARARRSEEYRKAGALTNQEILQLDELPDHLVIVGGSYIGLEFGQMFKRFGSEVTIIERNDRIISREDEEVSRTIKEVLEGEGINFRLNATCMGAKRLADGKISTNVDCRDGDPQVIGTHLLLAMGRVPNTDLLNLESTGVKTDEQGYIEVNDFLETNISGIYALGDCNGKGGFTHTAYNDYEIIAANAFGKNARKISDRITTYGLFVDPPLGRVGMTLAQAEKSGRKIKVGHRPMSRIARAKEKGETHGFMSVIIDATTDKILGAAVLGTGGDEIISGILNIMYADKPYTVIRDSVVPHPTVSELIPTMLEGLKSKD
ncbi:MAG: mercuric reductase [Saprospiraceae bacterium]|nr:mercuric reductase [Saprospiraceae bacterium]